MARVLVYAETRDGELRPVASEAVTAGADLAEQLGGSVDVFLLGPPGMAQRAPDLGRYGADRIFVAEDPAFSSYAADAAVRFCEDLVGRDAYAAVVFPASAQGKDLAPRAAARLDRGLATEVVSVGVDDGRPVATRPMFAGKAIATVAFSELPALISVRPNVFRPRERPAGGSIEVVEIASEPAAQRVTGIETGDREALDVSEANIVVSGGRGMKDPENWSVLEDLVEALGDDATLGASRAVVDAGWRPHSEQVGQTGKVVSPSLYFAVGISGAIQHLAGMRTAKTIVAINRDAEAPIFSVADYGIVGDLFEVVPALAAEIRRVRAGG
jgi:electron transfer flavoprotein alpha subunit